MFLLVHSPLVGPSTWSLTADALQARGHSAFVPDLWAHEATAPGDWSAFGRAMAGASSRLPAKTPVHLVAHSGAGPLLPHLSRYLTHEVASYVYVDAGLPRDKASFLDLLEDELPEHAAKMKSDLERGIAYPQWEEEALRSVVPDSHRRRRLVTEIHPQPLKYFQTPIPVPSDWPDAPCGYLQLSPAYQYSAERARQQGWLVTELEAGHFHMLVDPEAVAQAVEQLAERAPRNIV